MTWQIWSVSTLNWGSRTRVWPTDFPWGRVLNAGKGGSATFKLGDPLVRASANDTTLAPWERMLVAEFQGQVVYAGFITAADYDYDTQTMTVEHEDLWTVLKRRLVANAVNNGVATSVLVYTGVSNSNLIKQAIYEGQNDAVRFNLPIVLPADASGPVTKTLYGYHLPTAADLIGEAIGGENSPDVDLFPRKVSDGSIEWLLRVGTLNEGTWKWDASAAKSGVSGLRERRDGAKMANRIVAIGEGTEVRMKVQVADGSSGSSFLPLDAVTSYKKEDNDDRLAAQARADLAVRAFPTKQVSMDVRMNADFAVHQLRLGGTVNWRTQGDPHFADGWRASRLIEFSGDLTNRVHLEFQTAAGG